ncbi:MAG: DmsE family decaheme c-type cytochrome [Deltaproteobacteria bacterium]|jgi:DmsE family decaheme c-type cytochrome|nr:DmsE family decaheme c-type cytochrome [Deltaproteobacteria bacterium]
MLRKVSLTKAPRLVRLLPLLIFLGACATGAIREKQLTLPVIDGATPVGQETCWECHEGVGAGVHSRLASFEYMGGTEGCESCHGGGSLHVDSSGEKILNFDDMLPEESAAVCVKCHSGGDLIDWTHSEHALTDVACTDCHSIHAGGKVALKKQDPELCYDCHQEQMAKTMFPSHHPIKEGKMNCGSCHNPHAAEGLVTEERTNDLCIDCHTRYQGPFVFEHAPAAEDCTICHNPHGAVADNLLQQNEPFVCLQCHEGHFHALRAGQPVGTEVPDSPTSTSIISDPAITFTNPHGEEGWQKAFLTRCTACHSQHHGSDLPGQGAPDQPRWPTAGGTLTR